MREIRVFSFQALCSELDGAELGKTGAALKSSLFTILVRRTEDNACERALIANAELCID